jgi:hypothetical protein
MYLDFLKQILTGGSFLMWKNYISYARNGGIQFTSATVIIQPIGQFNLINMAEQPYLALTKLATG